MLSAFSALSEYVLGLLLQEEKSALADCIHRSLTHTQNMAVQRVAAVGEQALEGDKDVEAALARSLQDRRHSQVTGPCQSVQGSILSCSGLGQERNAAMAGVVTHIVVHSTEVS